MSGLESSIFFRSDDTIGVNKGVVDNDDGFGEFEDEVVSENVCFSFHSGSVNGKSITIFLSLILIPFKDTCADLAFVDSTKKTNANPMVCFLNLSFNTSILLSWPKFEKSVLISSLLVFSPRP